MSVARPDSRLTVTAVVVTHDAAMWLPRLRAGLVGQTRPPDEVVVVDTGSTDDTCVLVSQVPGWHLLRAERTTAPGAAWARGAAHLPRPRGEAARSPAGGARWLWLLHDDAVPAPDALQALLAVAARTPSAGVLGAKLRAWGRRQGGPRMVQEVGVTLSRGGRRDTGLDLPELDQGQYDQVRDVLAVSSAGMLIRADVWDELGGYDPALPICGDDVDFCWRARLAGHRVLVVPDAVLTHAAAASHGARPLALALPGPRVLARRWGFQARRAGCYTLLANRPWWSLPVTTVVVLLSGLLHALAALAVKDVGRGVDELAGPLSVLVHPVRLARARAARRPIHRVTDAEVSGLLAPRLGGLRRTWDAARARLSGAQSGPAAPLMALGSVAADPEPGPVSEEAQELPVTGGWRHLARRPGLVLTTALVLVTVIASRRLLGPGWLTGGALVAPPGDAGMLWESYRSAWHAVDLGSSAPTPPWVAVLAGLAVVLGGHVDAATDLLLLGAVPAAGVSAYLASRQLLAHRGLRVWLAAGYALLPALTGAVSTGQLGTVVAAVLLPVLAASSARALAPAGGSTATSAAFTAGLVLAVMSAFSPLAYLVMLVLAVVAGAALVRHAPQAARLAVLLVVPPLLLMPWTLHVAATPSLLLGQAGLPVGVDTPVPGWRLVFADPDGPSTLWMLAGAGVLLAALSALTRPTRRAAVIGAWTAALVGIVATLVLARIPLTGPAVTQPGFVWPGLPALVIGAGLLVAAALSAEGVADRLRAAPFGWRQPTAVLVAGVAFAAPALAGAEWMVRGADGPVHRADTPVVPAYAAAAARGPAAPRTLVLTGEPDQVRYALIRGAGAGPADAQLMTAPAAATPRVADTVADIASGRTSGVAARLTELGVRFVVVRGTGAQEAEGATGSASGELVERVDATEGMRRLSATGGGALWQVAGPTGRVRVTTAGGRTTMIVPTNPADGVRAAGQIPPAASRSDGGPPDTRLLVLAEQADPRWRATLDGHPLPATRHAGWAQAFPLPDTGGRVQIWYDGQARTRWLWAQAMLTVVVLIGAVPARRATGEPVADDVVARHALTAPVSDPVGQR
jgi:GT2 family glycosyltransferase